MKIKKIISLLLAVVVTTLMLSLPAFADSTDSSDFTITNGVLTKYNGTGGDVTIPSNVTSIGNEAFANCIGLRSITIPSSVVSIGDSAFLSCESLSSVAIPNSITSIGDNTFSTCLSLTSVTIPSSVTSIGNYAFFDCIDLTSVTIPSSVTTFYQGVFDNHCTNLTIYGEKNSCAQTYAAYESINFSANGVTNSSSNFTIENGVLTKYNGTGGSVTIPSSVTSIGNAVFLNRTDLTTVTIPSSVTSIGSQAFKDCTSLNTVTIPSSVTSIGDNTFCECTSLNTVTIPSSVTSIGDCAFYYCPRLISITVDADNSYYASEDGVLFNKNKTELIQYPCGNTQQSYTIPSSVTSIGDCAFVGCTSLTSVTIPSSITSIGFLAFVDCARLLNITVDADNSYYASENGVLFDKNITELIQYPCESTQTIYTIPSSVTSIGDSAFVDCENLSSVTIPSSVTSIGDNAFTNCNNLTIYGEKGSYAQTYAANNSITFSANGATSSSSDFTITNGVLTKYNGTGGSVTIPNSVTSIGDRVFEWNTSLTSVTIPSSVTSIGEDAFSSCSNLTSVTIPSSVTSIGCNAFYGTAWLENHSGDFVVVGNNILIGYKGSAANVTIPSGVTSIAGGAFWCCSNLTSATIPSSVTNIGDSAFYKCTSLTSITIPSSVASIDKDAFDFCNNFTIRGSEGSYAQTYAKNLVTQGYVVKFSVATSTEDSSTAIGVTYRAHVQSYGWQSYVSDGALSGTEGKSKRVEALNIKLTGDNLPTGASITYQAYAQSYGWMSAASNGTLAGTSGQGKRIEAMRVTLSGLTGYEVQYRVHQQSYGWSGWKTTANSTDISKASISGTTGKSKRIEAVEIKLVKIS